MTDDLTSATLWDRFWPKVDASGDCWLWTGATHGWGYGHIWDGVTQNKSIEAHRASWQLLVGPIPEGMTIDHMCRVPLCVNPGHLEPLPIFENQLRGYGWAAEIRRRGVCQRGHTWMPENIYVNPQGVKRCRECMLAYARARRRRAA